MNALPIAQTKHAHHLIQRRFGDTSPHRLRWLFPALLLASLLATSIAAPFQRIVWHEGFEDDNVMFRWSPSHGVWQSGKPAIGPTNVFAGKKCAATGLNRNSFSTISSTLESPIITLPPASESPRLRFWHWLAIHPNGHFGQVYVRLADGKEEALSERFYYSTTEWAPTSLDLSKYGGRRVQLLFFFGSHRDIDWPGWFIDEVEIVAGGQLFQGFEDFEGGWGDWSSSRGNWAIGKPAVGPKAAYSGTNCAAVILKGGRFPSGIESSLVSPPVIIPAASLQPRLRFWHWFQIHPNGHYAQVWIRRQNGTSEAISERYYYSTTAWAPVSLDLAKYAGQKVQILFYYSSYVDNDWTGWFIDDIQIDAKPEIDQQAVPEDFEGGWGDWSVSRGNWAIGRPQFGVVPSSGTNCAAVILRGGTFPIGVESSLVSPRFLIPSADANPRLSFQHLFKIHPNGHFGQVWVRTEKGTNEVLSAKYSGDSGGWASALLPLSKYAGQRVRFLFYFSSYVDNDWPGWFVDDVRVIPVIRNARPKFAGMPSRTVRAGEGLEMELTATDTDPGQTLTYTMDTNTSPVTARFDPLTRKFSWTPTLEDSHSSGYDVTFRVSDNGEPALSDIVVVPVIATIPNSTGDRSSSVAASLLLSDRKDHQNTGLRLIGPMRGFDYTLQSSGDLATWTTVVDNFPIRGRGQIPRMAGRASPEGNLFYRLQMQASPNAIP